ncbi:LysM peptidoglycan-binding domain-containing M23 family metallopeptidase [Massilia sp. PAMC28688]|uniref:peptidoglycan DD-metalloendopeptidase family protein n=1 Tax=Massilia sp. PAMC28688 TaxID=2861283 RepID=UPI001C63B143|nr:LysM peptidoglycan-binding domain-containing M23 family metallopeptidase [Massilia sp. PAMC28688]QYF95749.1 LysM peptidoglycan-binding domain-containing M23 family metallopeptidase [Massilia sp. PAMC28688]
MHIHEVKKGETLWKIGRQHKVTVEQLAIANNLKGRKIHQLSIGQRVVIPGKTTGTPDTSLALAFRGLDHKPIKPAKVKVEHDGGVLEYLLDASGSLALTIRDHAQGLKVWVEDMNKEMVSVLDRPILPIGTWNVAIDSRAVKIEGNLQQKTGTPATTTSQAKAATTHNARQTNGTTAATQTRAEAGKPIHALATIYTEENLRLVPGNEQYRKYIIAAAKKFGLTPQSLAALLDAEAAKKKGVWQEKSNESNPKLAQGLAQFFKPAWDDVFNSPKSLLHADCQKMSAAERYKKRLEAKYAIDGAATYASLNLKSFARMTKYEVDGLPPEDKAKLAYILHHEGLGGALRLIGKGKPFTQDSATSLLAQQLGKKNLAKLTELIEQYDGNAISAYKGWLYTYTDSKINVNHFLVQDQQKFATAPRSTSDIMGSLDKIAAAPKPAKKAAAAPPPATAKPASAPAAKPAAPAAPKPASPATTPAAAATGPVGDPHSKWFDPLDTCTLRTAKLAGKKSATFGMVRAGGKKPHQGIDLIAVPGTTVYAVADGEVYLAKSPNESYPYGHSLVLVVNIDDLPPAQAQVFKKVNPGQQTIGFYYAHLSEFLVPNKKPVEAGTPIAKTGDSGNAAGMTTVASGAHLHFEVRKKALLKCKGLENRVDPLPFIVNCTNR